MSLAEEYPKTFDALQRIDPKIWAMTPSEGLPTLNKLRAELGLAEVFPSTMLHDTMRETEAALEAREGD